MDHKTEEFIKLFRLDEIDENLEVIKYPGIYLAGELLDVDGDCGGYNLHFAFASGHHIAKTIMNKQVKKCY